MKTHLSTDVAETSSVESAERILSLDVLRGFAVLGILVMNIQAFSMPQAAYFLPTVYGNFEGINLLVWTVSHVLFDQKFMALFSMLFGAGLVLQAGKSNEPGTDNSKPKGIFWHRTFWLLVIGLVHAYLLWTGDILVTYAVCGALIFWCRHWSAKKLLFAGCVVLLIAPLLNTASFLGLGSAPPEVVSDLVSDFDPPDSAINAEVVAYQVAG